MRPLRSLTHATRTGLTLGAALALGGTAGLGAQAAPADTASASQPSESCSIVAPTQVVVDKPAAGVSVALGTDCPIGSVASWDLLAPGTDKVVQTIQLSTGDGVQVSLRPGAALGTYTLSPVTAADTDYDQLVQNTASMSVGLRTTTTAKATRAGKRVRVSAAVSTYERAKNRALPRAGAKVRLQRSTCATTCPWVDVTSATTNTKGLASFSAPIDRRTYLRVHTEGTATAWGTIGRPFRA